METPNYLSAEIKLRSCWMRGWYFNSFFVVSKKSSSRCSSVARPNFYILRLTPARWSHVMFCFVYVLSLLPSRLRKDFLLTILPARRPKASGKWFFSLFSKKFLSRHSKMSWPSFLLIRFSRTPSIFMWLIIRRELSDDQRGAKPENRVKIRMRLRNG